MHRHLVALVHHDHKAGGSTTLPQKRMLMLQSVVTKSSDEAVRLELDSCLKAAVKRNKTPRDQSSGTSAEWSVAKEGHQVSRPGCKPEPGLVHRSAVYAEFSVYRKHW